MRAMTGELAKLKFAYASCLRFLVLDHSDYYVFSTIQVILIILSYYVVGNARFSANLLVDSFEEY